MMLEAPFLVPKGLTAEQMDHRIRATRENGLSHPDATPRPFGDREADPFGEGQGGGS